MVSSVPQYIRRCAAEDFNAILDRMPAVCPELDIRGEQLTVTGKGMVFYAAAKISTVVDGVKYMAPVTWDYMTTSKEDQLSMSASVENLAKVASAVLKTNVNNGKADVWAGKIVRGQVIMAAEDDTDWGADAGFMSEDIGEGNIADSLEDAQNQLEDAQAQVEDIEEDPIRIESENNIDDHYIVECEKCQDIFISALVESSESVRKIHGICPLCNQESDQYLKWIVRAVSSDDFDDDDKGMEVDPTDTL